MHIGIRDGCLRQPALEAIATAARVGLDGVEICIGQDTSANVLWQDGGLKQVADAVERTGVAVPSLSPGHFASVHPVVDDPAQREVGRRLILDCIARCGPVGATAILVPMFPQDMAVWPDTKWHALVDGFKPLSEAAGRAGVVLALESTFSADQLECIVDGVDHPSLTVYYDLANTTHRGYHPPAELRDLGARVGMIHVKDTDGRHLGDGRVDWPGCHDAIRTIGYDGWFVLETPAGDDPVLSAARNYGFTRGWLAR